MTLGAVLAFNHIFYSGGGKYRQKGNPPILDPQVVDEYGILWRDKKSQ